MGSLAFKFAIGWSLVFPAFGLAQGPDLTRFDLAFAEGIWSFSQGSDLDAVNYFQEASHLRPNDGFSKYMLGLSYMRIGKFREAAAKIEASSADGVTPPPVEPSRVLVDLGAAQLAAGDVQTAIRTLEEALQDRPTDPVARHYYDKARGLVGRQQEGEAVLDLPVTFPAVTTQSAAANEPRWTGSVGVLAGHDSNPNLLSEDLLLPIPSSSQNPKLVSGRSSDSVASADLRVSHRPIPLFGGWSLAADFREEGSFHQDFQYLNVVRTGAVVHLAHGTDPLGALEGPLGSVQVPAGSSRTSMLLQGGIEELRLDNASYLRLSTLAGAVTFAPSPDNATRLDVRLLDRSYYRHRLADSRRNGQEVSVGVHQISHLGGKDRLLTLGFEASDRHAGSAFRRTLLGGDVEAVFPVATRWTVRLGAWVNKEKFDDPASNLFSSDPASPARRDRTWGSSAALAFEINDRLRFLLRGSYQNRDSNVTFDGGLPALDYRRTVVETGLSWAF